MHGSSETGLVIDPSGWYELVPSNDDSLWQGDLLTDVGVPIMPPEKGELDSNQIVDQAIEYKDVIVLSQSCDLHLNKLAFALVCPYVTLEKAKAEFPHLKASDERENLRRGQLVGLHPLNQCKLPDHDNDFLVVNFRQAFTVPMEYLLKRVRAEIDRLRLCSPYREHLAQAYARFIMRIGLPVDIPKLP